MADCTTTARPFAPLQPRTPHPNRRTRTPTLRTASSLHLPAHDDRGDQDEGWVVSNRLAAMQVAARASSFAGASRRTWMLGLLVMLGAWLLLAWTCSGVPIVWDEGEYLFRASSVASWFRLLFSVNHPQGGLNALSDAVILQYWPFVIAVEGHPAWSAVPIALGNGLSGFLHPLTAARFGPMVVFSLACGAVAYRLHREWGAVAAIAAPIAMLAIPRMFAEAHFATQDGQLTAWWLMLWVADTSRDRRMRNAVLTGALLGLTCATKFTGWFAVIPVVVGALVARSRGLRRLLILAPVALFTFYIVNPPLWSAPVDRFATHVYLNLNRPDLQLSAVGQSSQLPDVWGRQQRPPLRLREYLLGSMRYDIGHRYAPWYNTIAWWLVATPLFILILGLIGVRPRSRLGAASIDPLETADDSDRDREHARLLLMLHWATPMVVRALPGMPANDGIRLILPAFGFWAVLAAIGAQRLWRGVAGMDHRSRRIASTLVLTAAAAATVVNVARYHPQTLSHYNLLVGGVRGASQLGFEPTYWWDALDDEVLDWLNTHTEPSVPIAFSFPADLNVSLLRSWGKLHAGVTEPHSGTRFKWYVVQNRPSALSPIDRALICCEEAVYTKYPGRHPRGVPVDLAVPLLFVFSNEQYESATERSGRRQ